MTKEEIRKVVIEKIDSIKHELYGLIALSDTGQEIRWDGYRVTFDGENLKVQDCIFRRFNLDIDTYVIMYHSKDFDNLSEKSILKVITKEDIQRNFKEYINHYRSVIFLEHTYDENEKIEDIEIAYNKITIKTKDIRDLKENTYTISDFAGLWILLGK